MLDFNYYTPTKIYFGKNKIDRLNNELKNSQQRILLIYGSGSIKQNQIYESLQHILEKNNIFYKEHSGIQPNPTIESVRNGIDICKKNQLTFILAVGGGSVIDCAKTIAAGYYYPNDPWELFMGMEHKITQALPIGTILTITGTGSEMNGNAVITNKKTSDKLAIHSDLLRPRFSILDPTFTFSVPKEQTAAGIVDIISHILEQYFSLVPETFIQDRFAETLLTTCIKYGPIAIKDPQNYSARSQLMWASSLALNGLLSSGKTGDWATHAIEHALSAMYNITHGVGLAILTPFWMEYVLKEHAMQKFVDYAQNVWNIKGTTQNDIAQKGIKKTRDFFSQLNMPQRLSEVGFQKKSLKIMAKKSTILGDIGKFKKLTEQDVYTILTNAY